jgi:YVTN family beta-propeller protein
MLAVSSADQGAVLFFNVIGGGLYLDQIASVHVGVHPGEMCLAPDENQLYVNTRGEKGAVIIDVRTQTVTGVLKAPGMDTPDSCVVSPDSKKVYVVDPAAASIFVFSAETKQFETEIHVGKEPRRVIFSPDHKSVLVSNSQANTLSVISAADNKVVRTIKTGNEPRDMVFSPDGKLLAVTLIDDDSVEFFKADTLDFKEQVGAVRSPQHLGFTPDSQRLYIVGKISDEVAVMHIGSHSRVDFTIPINRGPLGVMGSWGFAMTPDAQYLFVTNLSEGTVSVIDTHSMKLFRAFPAGQAAIDVVYIKAKGGTVGLDSNARI